MTTYNTLQDVTNAGYDIKCKHGAKYGRFTIRDVSEKNSFGYDYALFDEGGNVVAHSHTVWYKTNKTNFGEAFTVRMRSDEIKTAVSQ
jgi:hypothetical protein